MISSRRAAYVISFLAICAVSLTACIPTSVVNHVLLPASCQTDCVTPYGAELGSTSGNVIAYSNCKAGCGVYLPHHDRGTYTGIEWQCVEFARRWLFDTHGVVFGDVPVAADLWRTITTVTRISDGKQFPFVNHDNGDTAAPQVGDVLIYAREYLGTGHVAVITHVDTQTGLLNIAEQNYLNSAWPAGYARQVPFIQRAGHYWVLDPYVLGWKRVML